MTQPPSGQTPPRVVVTGPRRDVRSRPHRPVAEEIDRQTGVGEVYVRSLVRAQLLLGLAAVAVVVVPLAAMPVLFAALPEVRTLSIAGVPLWWLLLGLLVYPAIFAVGWWYVRRAERTERRFTTLVERR